MNTSNLLEHINAQIALAEQKRLNKNFNDEVILYWVGRELAYQEIKNFIIEQKITDK